MKIKCPHCQEFAKTNTVFHENFFICKCQNTLKEIKIALPLRVFFEYQGEEFGIDETGEEVVFFNGNLEITKTISFKDIKNYFNLKNDLYSFVKNQESLLIDLKK